MQNLNFFGFGSGSELSEDHSKVTAVPAIPSGFLAHLTDQACQNDDSEPEVFLDVKSISRFPSRPVSLLGIPVPSRPVFPPTQAFPVPFSRFFLFSRFSLLISHPNCNQLKQKAWFLPLKLEMTS
jgi:hypothetical protein